MYMSVPYSCMEEVYVVARWDVGYKFCIRIVVSDGSLLLQVRTKYFYIILLQYIKTVVANTQVDIVWSDFGENRQDVTHAFIVMVVFL
jgi:hypothetical protein